MGNYKTIAINSIIILVRLIVTTVVGLVAARFVLQALGVSDYGLYSVVGGIVALLNILNASMTTSTYRFIAFELGKGKKGKTREVFNASLFIHFLLMLLILIVGGILGLWYINNFLNVSDGNIEAARFVFWISLITTAFSTLLVPFQGLMVAFERFLFIALADIVIKIAYFIVIVVFTNKQILNLKIYSLIMLANTAIFATSFMIYSIRHYLYIVKIKFVRDWATYKDMLYFTFWTLFGGIGNIGHTQGSVMLINYFFGTIVNAPYAIANQIKGFVHSFSTTLCQAAVPQITKEYSAGNLEKSVSLTCHMSKYTFLLMLLPVFPLLMEMDFILELWLKDVPLGTSVFCKLVLLEGLIWCLGAGIPSLINATGNIKNYQIITYTLIFMGLPVSFVFFKLGSSAYMISVVYCIITLIVAFIKLYFVNKLLDVDIRVFFERSYSRILLVSLPLIVLYIIYDPLLFSDIQHVMGLFFSEIVLLLIIYLIGLNKKEKELVINYINNKLFFKIKNIVK